MAGALAPPDVSKPVWGGGGEWGREESSSLVLAGLLGRHLINSATTLVVGIDCVRLCTQIYRSNGGEIGM